MLNFTILNVVILGDMYDDIGLGSLLLVLLWLYLLILVLSYLINSTSPSKIKYAYSAYIPCLYIT